jgi:hypothetical protein
MVEGCVQDLKRFKKYFGTNHSNYETRERENKGGNRFLVIEQKLAKSEKNATTARKKRVWPWFQSQKAIFLSKKRKHKVTHLFNGNFGDFCETFSLGQSQR